MVTQGKIFVVNCISGNKSIFIFRLTMITNKMIRYHISSSELKEDFLWTFHNLQRVLPSHHCFVSDDSNILFAQEYPKKRRTIYKKLIILDNFKNFIHKQFKNRTVQTHPKLPLKYIFDL